MTRTEEERGRGHSREWQDGRRNGIKLVVSWLRDEAARMNDPHAKTVLNNASFHFGTFAKRGGATVRAAIAKPASGEAERDPTNPFAPLERPGWTDPAEPTSGEARYEMCAAAEQTQEGRPTPCRHPECDCYSAQGPQACRRAPPPPTQGACNKCGYCGPVDSTGAHAGCAYLAAVDRASPPPPTQGDEERAREWHIGSMNDALFIIDRPPSPSNDHPWHDNPNGPAAISFAIDDRNAIAIVKAHNNALRQARAEGMEEAAKTLNREADKHEESASQMERDYKDFNVKDEISQHRWDADTLRRAATAIRARMKGEE